MWVGQVDGQVGRTSWNLSRNGQVAFTLKTIWGRATLIAYLETLDSYRPENAIKSSI